MRDFTFNLTDNDFIRITGYLVRKSDLEEYDNSSSRYNSTVLGAGAVQNKDILDRKKRVVNYERNPGTY